MAIDLSMAVSGGEWSIPMPEAPSAPGASEAAPAPGRSGGFGDMLQNSIASLSATQTEAASAAQALATGQDVDPTSVVLATERAQLSMQMASQMRTKATEAYQDIFRTQV